MIRVFLGFVSWRPTGLPIFLSGRDRDASRCHVSLDHVLPVQMSRTAFSLTPYFLDTDAALIKCALQWNISRASASVSLALVLRLSSVWHKESSPLGGSGQLLIRTSLSYCTFKLGHKDAVSEPLGASETVSVSDLLRSRGESESHNEGEPFSTLARQWPP